MYIAHSAMRLTSKAVKKRSINAEMQQRIDAYNTTCAKYRQEITEIQKYLPGWRPAFNSSL